MISYSSVRLFNIFAVSLVLHCTISNGKKGLFESFKPVASIPKQSIVLFHYPICKKVILLRNRTIASNGLETAN